MVFFELFDIDEAGELAIGAGKNSFVLFVEIDLIDCHLFCTTLVMLCRRCHGVALSLIERVFFAEGRAPERDDKARSAGA
jgi:hypothetical protein